MNNLILLLLAIFGGLALIVLILERFARPMEPERVQRLSRWIYPLVGVALVLALLRHYLPW